MSSAGKANKIVNAKKHFSKSSRSAWRKHSNIDDVEEFLEDKRLDERIGLVDNLPNEALFQIDCEPHSISIPRRLNRAKLLEEPPKCFSILNSYTKVPDPIIKRNRVKTREEKQKNAIFKKKLKRHSSDGSQSKSVDKSTTNDVKDIWSVKHNSDQSNSWINSETVTHTLIGTNNTNMVVKKPPHKFCATPSIEYPHPGISYNPSFQDHQSLLQEVGKAEIKIIKEEQHLQRVTTQMFRHITEDERHTEWLNQHSSGYDDIKVEVDDSKEIFNLPVRNCKKTLKQRRKQKEQRQLFHQRKAIKCEKKKLTDLHNIQGIMKTLSQRDTILTKRAERRATLRTKKHYGTKRLSSIKYNELGSEFKMPKEISGNLRSVGSERNLLLDRYDSFKKRNIVQPTKVHSRKKPKVKKYISQGYKADWKDTVALNLH